MVTWTEATSTVIYLFLDEKMTKFSYFREEKQSYGGLIELNFDDDMTNLKPFLIEIFENYSKLSK